MDEKFGGDHPWEQPGSGGLNDSGTNTWEGVGGLKNLATKLMRGDLRGTKKSEKGVYGRRQLLD